MDTEQRKAMITHKKYSLTMSAALMLFSIIYAYNFSGSVHALSDFIPIVKDVDEEFLKWDKDMPGLFFFVSFVLAIVYFGRIYFPEARSGVNGAEDFSAIERLYDFRNARLNGMGNEDGAALLGSTPLLDAAMQIGASDTKHVSPEVLRTMRYMNGRLNGMNNADGLNWVASGMK